MDKQEFLKKLRQDLPAEDREERILFYTEMIEDRMEEGLSEEEAVASVGSLDEILAQSPEANALPAAPKQKRQLKTWEIVLLLLGSPIWLSLIVAAVSVAFAAVAVLLSGVIVLWSLFVATAAVSLAGLVSGVALVFIGSGISGTAMIGAAITCAGLAIFCFCGGLAASKGVVLTAKKLVRWSKNRFGKKEALA